MAAGILTVRNLRHALLANHSNDGTQPTALSALAASAFACLPASWKIHTATTAEPTASTYCDQTQSHVSSSANTQQPGVWLGSVLPDGRIKRLEPMSWPHNIDTLTWEPCLVLSVPKPASRITRQDSESMAADPSLPPPEEEYLAGRWSAMDVDPSAWNGATGKPITHFQVCDAALRMKHLQLIDKYPSYSPSAGIQPKVWAALDGSGGLHALEAKWVAEIANRAPVVASVIRRPREDTAASPPQQANACNMTATPPPPAPDQAGPSSPARMVARRGGAHADWDQPPQRGEGTSQQRSQQSQRPHPAPRPLPDRGRRETDVKDRVRAAASIATSAVQLQVPAPALAQQAAAPAKDPPPNRKAWKRLKGTRLPREVAVLGWRIMHGSLYCRAFTSYLFNTPTTSSYCTAACCSQKPETLTHLFMECDTVRPAVDWFLDLWLIIGGTRPPKDAQVLLADDHRVWAPTQELAELWNLLRLEFLYVVWSARCARNSTHVPFQAAGVAARVVARMRKHIELDWVRTSTNVRRLSSACTSWFRGKDPRIPRDDFISRWGPVGVLCVVTGVAGAVVPAPAIPMHMTVLFSTSAPLALPVSLAPLPLLPDDLY